MLDPDCCMFLYVGYATVACISSLLYVSSCVAMLWLLCKLYVAMQQLIKFVTLQGHPCVVTGEEEQSHHSPCLS
jgi:hypothetical protein